MDWPDKKIRIQEMPDFHAIEIASVPNWMKYSFSANGLTLCNLPNLNLEPRWKGQTRLRLVNYILNKCVPHHIQVPLRLPALEMGPLFPLFAPHLSPEEFRMRRQIPLLLLLFLSLNLFAQESKKPMVAVLPFTSRVLDTSAIDGLVSAMGSELINTGAFRVMERSQMDGILKEQGFQQSGACDGQECAVEVGKLLSVDQMVLGTIAKVGSTYTLTARLVSVQTGEVLKSVTRNSRADVDAILTDILPQVAGVLAGAGKLEPAAVTNPVVAAPAVVAAPIAVQASPAFVPDRQAEASQPPSVTPVASEEAPKQGSHWGWWVAGGALVAGGATAAVLLMSGNSSSSPSTTTVHASW